MRNSWITVAGIVLTCGAACAQAGVTAAGSQSAAATAGPGSASASSTQNVQATLTKNIDAKNAKVGDEVAARTTAEFVANGTRVPRGSKLIGHVTEAQARGRENAESRLGVLFDRAEPRGGGQPVPVAFRIAGVTPPASMASSGSEQADMDAGITTPGAGASTRTSARAGGGGLLGGAGSAVGGVTRGVGQAGSAVADTTGSTLRSAGNTVTGTAATAGSMLQGVTVSTTGSAGAVLSSTTRNVQLQSGSSLTLTGAASTQ